MSTPKLTFSEELRAVIAASGHTPSELGRLAKVNSGMISRFTDGSRGLTTTTLDRLAEALSFGVAERVRVRRGRPPGRPSSKAAAE